MTCSCCCSGREGDCSAGVGGGHGHRPVMVRELLASLELSPGLVVMDCTIGAGGHAAEVLAQIVPGGKLVGIDWDEEALRAAGSSLSCPREEVLLARANFADAPRVLAEFGIERVDRMYLDLGLSSMQVDSPDRGFSFRGDGMLDMRMDRSLERTASDVVMKLSEKELGRVIREYGEERYWRSVARAIVRSRDRRPIQTTGELAEIVSRAVRRRPRRIHAATRTFQALRIEVNGELENLSRALDHAPDLLSDRGIVSAISFHSLEDRIVKRDFREKKQQGIYASVSKKPVVPGAEEKGENPRSRSAKLRTARKEG